MQADRGLPRTVDRQRARFQSVADHQRDQLLGELVGAVIVRGAGNHNRQLVGDEIRAGQQVRTRLGGRVGAARV